MMYWEILLIVRGYRHRNVLLYQLQRLTAWGSIFSMGNPQHKTPEDITGKLYFDRYIQDEDESNLPTEDEVDELYAEATALFGGENKKNPNRP
jgi:hypothetical protein